MLRLFSLSGKSTGGQTQIVFEDDGGIQKISIVGDLRV
jgi:hypothetical protein